MTAKIIELKLILSEMRCLCGKQWLAKHFNFTKRIKCPNCNMCYKVNGPNKNK